MSAAMPLRQASSELDRARNAERVQAELEHIGNVLAEPIWLSRSQVVLADLECPEARAIFQALTALGPNGLIGPNEWDIPAVAGEIATNDLLIGAMALHEHENGIQSVRSRLDEIRYDRGAIGQTERLARQIRRQARESQLRILYRRGAAGEGVFHEIARIGAEIDDIEAGLGTTRVESPAERWRASILRGGDADPLRCPRYLIRDLIAPGYLVQLVGASGTIKTGLLTLMAGIFAVGGDFLGRPTRAGRSLLIFAEGSGGAPGRLAALYKQFPNLQPDDVVALTVPVLFGREGESESFTRFVVEDLVHGHDRPIRMIAIDTYSQSIEGSASDDDVFAGFERGVRHLLKMVEREQGEGAFAIFSHHPGHGPQDRGRGSYALIGNSDAILTISPRVSDFKSLPIGERVFDVTITKTKDFEDGWSFSYRGGLEELGEDSEGFPVRAPIVKLLSDDEACATRAANATAGRRIPQSARRLIELVLRIERRDGRQIVPRQVLAASGYLDSVTAQGWDPAVSIYGIPVSSLQEMVYAEDSDIRTDEDGRRTVDDAARKRWERKRNALINCNAAWTYDGWLWLVGDTGRAGADGDNQ